MFERNRIYNHTDKQDRYCYSYQTAKIQYATRALHEVCPLIVAKGVDNDNIET